MPLAIPTAMHGSPADASELARAWRKGSGEGARTGTLPDDQSEWQTDSQTGSRADSLTESLTESLTASGRASRTGLSRLLPGSSVHPASQGPEAAAQENLRAAQRSAWMATLAAQSHLAGESLHEASSPPSSAAEAEENEGVGVAGEQPGAEVSAAFPGARAGTAAAPSSTLSGRSHAAHSARAGRAVATQTKGASANTTVAAEPRKEERALLPAGRAAATSADTVGSGRQATAGKTRAPATRHAAQPALAAAAHGAGAMGSAAAVPSAWSAALASPPQSPQNLEISSPPAPHAAPELSGQSMPLLADLTSGSLELPHLAGAAATAGGRSPLSSAVKSDVSANAGSPTGQTTGAPAPRRVAEQDPLPGAAEKATFALRSAEGETDQRLGGETGLRASESVAFASPAPAAQKASGGNPAGKVLAGKAASVSGAAIAAQPSALPEASTPAAGRLFHLAIEEDGASGSRAETATAAPKAAAVKAPSAPAAAIPQASHLERATGGLPGAPMAAHGVPAASGALVVDAAAPAGSAHALIPGREAGPASATLAGTGTVSPFQVMDSAPSGGAASGLTHAHASSPASSLAAGYHDPELGYIELKAEMGSDGVHARLAAATAEGSTILSAHLPALHQWLTERQTPVDRLSVGIREDGASGFSHPDGHGGSSHQGAFGRQSAPSSEDGQARQETLRSGAVASTGTGDDLRPMDLNRGSAPMIAPDEGLSGRSATYISVVA